MSTTYDDFMTTDRIDSIIHTPHTLQGLHYLLETLVQTAYIPNKPPSFYNFDLYMLIGKAYEISNEVIKNDTS